MRRALGSLPVAIRVADAVVALAVALITAVKAALTSGVARARPTPASHGKTLATAAATVPHREAIAAHEESLRAYARYDARRLKDGQDSGTLLGKILVLVLIILFIQKRPRGLFALKGRAIEA